MMIPKISRGNLIKAPHNNRMQPDFGELTLPSAADAERYEL